jgi:gliding motility-associated-like protein
VQAKNAAGCIASDKVKVIVSNEDASGGLFIPNTFSPNSDGANDIFYARSAGSIKINRFKIMNREGATVFEKNNFYTNDVSSGWDGTYRGSKLAIDVYVDGVEIICLDGKLKVISGNVSLVR